MDVNKEQNKKGNFSRIGAWRCYPEKNGCIIGPMDILIAAHAKSLDFTLATNNMYEFSRVKGLKLENWV